MRTFIWCCLIAVLGGGLYGLSRYASRHPDSTTGACVKTACEVGCRSNPLLPSAEDEEDIPSVPAPAAGTPGLPPTTPAPASIADALGDPVPFEPVSFPSDPVAAPLDPVDVSAPIVIRPEDPAPRPATRVMPRTDDATEPTTPGTPVEFPLTEKPMPRVEDPTPANTKTMPRADDEPGEEHGRAPSIHALQMAWNDSSEPAEQAKTHRDARPEEQNRLRGLHQLYLLLMKESSSNTHPVTGRCHCIDTLEIRNSDQGWWTQIGWGPL